jgi:hypothetical protein
MAEQQCPVCGRHFYAKTGQHVYCTTVCRARARVRAPGTAARYGGAHQRLRAALAPAVASGAATCSRCGERVEPGDEWDLDHLEGSSNEYRGVSHQYCNRAAGADLTNAKTAKSKPYPEDDPARGVFWGPPPGEGQPPRPWSQKWYEWRAEEVSEASK